TVLGEALLEIGRFDEAIPVLREALSRDPEDSVARVALAGALHFTGIEQEAADLLLTDDSWHDDPNGHAVLGETLNRLNQNEEALAELDKARELAPGWADVDAARGQVLYELGRLPEAEQVLRSALEPNPDDDQTV